MNGQQIYDLTTKLLGNIEMDLDLFCALLNTAKTIREGSRDWANLKRKDTSITISPGDTIDTAKSTPAAFIRPIKGTDKTKAVVLLDSNGNKASTLDEIPYERQYDYKNIPGYFFVDYGDANRPIYVTGQVSSSMTAALFYIAKTRDIVVADIGDSSTWEWELFNSRYAALLAYDVAIQHKGNIDWDEINARMVQFTTRTVDQFEFAMIMEDERIKLSTLGV